MEQIEEPKAKIELPANATFFLVLAFSILFVGGLIFLNIYQFKQNADLRVKVEQVKISVFLETEELIIEKYWLEQIAKYKGIIGNSLLETNKTLLETLETLEETKE